MIKLIATDLDGTLLDANSAVTPRTARAVRAAMAAGAAFCLSSGRMTESMMRFATDLEVNAPMILFNGALIYDHRTGEELYRRAIPADAARAVAECLEEMGLYFQIYPGTGYYCERRCDYTDSYEESIRVPCQQVGTKLSGWMQGGMIKMLAIAPPEVLDPAQAELIRRFPDVRFMKSRAHYLEIVSQGIDKAAALTTLGDHLGVSREEIMAFGDGQNDASMLAAAGLGVCMENGVAECRQAAKRIAPANTEDGVAQVLEEMIANGEIGGMR